MVQSDRGGQVTYHGPGQLVAYLLLDLRRAGLGVKGLVHLLEQAVIDLLAEAVFRPRPGPMPPGSMWPGPRSPPWACGCARVAAITAWP